MIVVKCQQGSDEWLQARAGVITASMFSIARQKVGGLTEQQQLYVDAIRAGKSKDDAKLIAGYKSAPTSETLKRALDGEKVGQPSEMAKDYAFRLAVERISGQPLDEGFQTFAMRRGNELEPEARFAHELAAGVKVERCGFVMTDDNVFGGSADGLIGEDGGSEYKCLIAPDRLREVLIDNNVSEFADQVQGCLWLTGRKFWHFAIYCPALAPIGKELWWREWKRDEEYIEALETDLLEFKAIVDANEAQLRSDVRIAA